MPITKIKKSQLDSFNITNADIDNSAAIASTKLADGANFLKKDGSVVFTANQSFGGYKATNLATPTADTDAATKLYVDQAAQGLNVKTAVRLATTDNITLTGLQSPNGIDGIALVAGDRILVKNQTNPAQNGVYDASTGNWARSSDSDSESELVNAFYFVIEGNTLQATGFTQSTPTPIVVGTTALVFNQFSGSANFIAGAGLTKTLNTFNVGTASTDRIVVNSDSIDLAFTGVTANTYTKVTVDTYGRVTSASQATTSDIAEGTNQYFTNTRAQNAITGAASTIATANLTVGRALVSDANGKVSVSTVTGTQLGYLSGVTSAIQTQLNAKQGSDATLTAIAGVTTAADKLIYFTGIDTATSTTLTGFARTLLDDIDAIAARATLGVAIGSNVQQYSSELAVIAGLTGATSGLLRRTSGTWALDTATYLTENQPINVSGDASGSGTNAITLTLASIVTAGTYTKVTVDSKGRVTTGANLGIADLPSGTISISNIITRETPNPLPNGVTNTFTCLSASAVGTEHVYLNGVLMEPGVGNDYIVTSQSPFTIQMTFIPIPTDKIRISYINI